MTGRARKRSVLAALLAAAAGCGSESAAPSRDGPADAAVEAPAVAAALPSAPGRFAPSFTVAPESVTGAGLADVEACGVCHADVAAQWQASSHAEASFDNPIYRASIDGFRAAGGERASHFCAGCHDPALLVDGAMLAEVAPADPRARAGVTCRVCHGIERATIDGNGSYVLAAVPISIPARDDAASIEEHKRTAALSPLRTDAMCGSCHRAFLSEATGTGHHLASMDDFGAWQRSAYSGSGLDRIDDGVEARACRSCHMPMEAATRGDAAATDGAVASHRFAGGHTWLAAMRGDADQLAAARALLATAATIDVAPVDGTVEAGDTVTLDVVVRNTGTGHRFPGGTLDAHDTWIEVRATDATGAPIAAAGVDHETDFEDPTAHTLRALVVDEAGAPALERDVHRFRTVVWNHTIAPRDAAAVQYRLAIPDDVDDAAWPVTVTARLRHRSRGLPLQRVACAAARDERGLAFAVARDREGKPALDPCAPQPITDIARARIQIGAGATATTASAGTWQRFYDHGLAMSHARQERVDEARPSLDRALGAAGRRNAMASLQLARVAGSQGRLREALEWADRAAQLVPSHAGVSAARAAAYAQVWQWPAAAEHARAAAEVAPGDDRAWAALAVAEGSAGRPAEAFAAAVRGLALSPRDPDLLRAQALALRALGRDDAGAAMEAYLDHRRRDDAPAMRAKCSASVPGCARDRDPVHTHDMITPDSGCPRGTSCSARRRRRP